MVASALEGVWHKLMASSSPDWPKVSEVMRRLLQLAGSDTEKLRLYRCVHCLWHMCPALWMCSSKLLDRPRPVEGV